MKELLRIINGTQDTEKSYRLNKYNMELYTGEIMYVQGLSGSGIKGLLELFQGERPFINGSMYIKEQLISAYSKSNKEQYRIYIITGDKDLVADMTVAENIEAVRFHSKTFKYYHKEQINKRIDEFLENEKIDLSAKDVLKTTDRNMLIKLSILKAKMNQANLIVLDCMTERYGEKTLKEICQMLLELKEGGTSIIILSERYSILAEIADRIQLIYQGRDLMEWYRIDHHVKTFLKKENYVDGESKGDATYGHLIGVLDNTGRTLDGIWKYLEEMKKENEEIYCKLVGEILPQEGRGLTDNIVVVPKDSSEQLIEKLTIEDNIILTIPGRISHHKYGYISKKIKKNIANRFYEEMRISKEKTHIRQLDRVQRKILSIYRFVIAKPSLIIFENPYWGMDIVEIERLSSYINSIRTKGIQCIFFSDSLEELEYDCSEVYVRNEGAKISPLLQKIPPKAVNNRC